MRNRAKRSLSKSVIGAREEPLAAARREFLGETEFFAEPPFNALGRCRQNSGKNLSVWAAEGDVDPAALVSNTFAQEWPPRSGIVRDFPEADRAAWLSQDEAWQKIVKGKRVVLEHFYAAGA